MTRKVIAYITHERGGETLEHAARRQVREEVGLTILAGLEFIGAMTQTAFGAAEEWNFFRAPCGSICRGLRSMDASRSGQR